MPSSAAAVRTITGETPRRRAVPELARLPVFSAMLALAVVLTATSGRYGYHRDELYFRMLRPGWGYVDEPPLTPLLARGFDALADQVWALRIPATIAAVLSVLALALVTRELGGGRGAQALCAWGYAFAALPLAMGHVLLTSTIDLPVWPLFLLFVLRAQLRNEPRWWLAAGLVVGLSMYNKLLIAVLIVALAAGVALVGPRRILWSPWVLAATVLALVVGAPNVLYQVTHDWPQLSMGRALADDNGDEVRVLMWPFLLILLGPPLVPIWVTGLVGLARRPQWRAVRFLAPAFPALLVLVFLMGSQFYYPMGLLAVLYAAGCVPVVEWLRRGSGWRRGVVAAAVALNAAVSAVLGLPLLPVGDVGSTPVPAVNQIVGDSIGWRTYVAQIADVYRSLPDAERRTTVLVTSNYGEAGALDRYGLAVGLPAVYSGQNQLYFQGPPPASASTAIFVGGQLRDVTPLFRSCRVLTHLDNGVGVDNEEQGQPVAVCRYPVGGWRQAWPRVRHED